MNIEQLNKKVWYRITKLIFILVFILCETVAVLGSVIFTSQTDTYSIPIKEGQYLAVFSKEIKTNDGTESFRQFFSFDHKPKENEINQYLDENFLNDYKYDHSLSRNDIVTIINNKQYSPDHKNIPEFLNYITPKYDNEYFNVKDPYYISEYKTSSQITYSIVSFIILLLIFWLIRGCFLYAATGRKYYFLHYKDPKIM